MKTRVITFFLLFALSMGLFAQPAYKPSEENLKAREEFQDNKFGIFLHWGLYAMLATGEWRLSRHRVPNISASLPAIMKGSPCSIRSIPTSIS